MGYSPWGRKELDTTGHLHFHFLPFTSLVVLGKSFDFFKQQYTDVWASLVAQMVKSLPTMRETQV